MEVRQIPEKGVAFIEFASDDLAAFALQEVREQGLMVFPGENGDDTVTARISFGKK